MLAHSFQAKQVVVQRPEALPGVFAAVSSTHQELQHQSDVDQRDLVIWRKIPLKKKSCCYYHSAAGNIHILNDKLCNEGWF